MRQMYSTKIDTCTAESSSEMVLRSGIVSEYAVASVRNVSSMAWLRSRVIPDRRWPRLRYCHQAMNTTIDQPMPISSRLEPVMLARAREHGEASLDPGGTQDGP